jgi:phage-related protein
MAIVGEAYVIVRANTSSVERDIRKSFNGVGSAASSAGRNAGERFNAAFRRSQSDNVFGKFSAGLSQAVRGADAARAKFHDLVRAGYAVGTAMAGAAGGISAIIGGLGALVGAAGGAAASLAAVGNVVASLGLGLGVAKLALGGVGKAVGAITAPATGGGSSGGGSSGGVKGTPGVAAHVTEEAQLAYSRAMRSANEAIAESEERLAEVIQSNRKDIIDANDAVRDAQISLTEAIAQGREEIKQLGFDAEDAALSERRAALELEKARAALAAVQDLPPNDAARTAAELAYQEAELNLRKAKDASASLNAEQARLAKTGVQGTEVVINATRDLAEAQNEKSQAVVDGLKDQRDAEEDLARARRDAAETKADGPNVTEATKGTGDFAPGASAGGGGGGGVDPFSGLNQAQINFAKFIASLKPKFDELKRIAAEGFLPPLQTAIQNLVDRAFPTVAEGVGIIARAMGVAVNHIVDAITSAKDLENLSTIFESSGVQIENLGLVVGNLFSALLTILAASSPLAERFTGFLVTATEKFDTFLSGAQDDGSLGTFFTQAGDAAAAFGDIFGNLFSGFGALIQANIGPGSGGMALLNFFQEATAGLQELDGTASGEGSLRQYFLDVANNAMPVLTLVGQILKVFLDLGANPAIGEAAAILSTAVPSLEKIVKASADAAPQLAELTVKILEIFAALQDTGAIQVFFDTLTSVADVILNLFGNEAAVAVFTFTGRIAAVLAAFGLVGKLGSFAFKAVAGSIGLASKTLGGMVTAGKGLGEVSSILRIAKQDGAGLSTAFSVLKDSTNPLSKAIGNVGGAFTTVGSKAVSGLKTAGSAIAQGVTATGTLAKQQVQAAAGYAKVGGAAVANGAKVAASTVATKAAAAGNLALAAGQKVAAAATRIFNAALSANPIGLIITAIALLVAGLIYFFTQTELGREIWANFTQFLSEAWNNIVAVAQTVFQGLADFFNLIWQAIVLAVTTYITVVQTIITTVTSAISTAWNAVWQGIKNFFGAIWAGIVFVVTSYINIVRTVVTTVVNAIKTVWNNVWQGIKDFFGTIWNGIVTFVRNYIATVQNVINTVTGAIKAKWNEIWGAIKNFFSDTWSNIVNGVKIYIATVRDTISNVTNAIKSKWNDIWNGIKNFFGDVWDGIVSKVSSIGQTFKDAFSSIGGFIKSAFSGALNAVKMPINGIIGLVNRAIRSLNGLSVRIPDWVPGVGGGTFGVNLPTIPQLAKGGIIRPTSGGTLVNVAEAGRPERVEPLDDNGLSKRDIAMINRLAPGGGGTVQINVTAAPGMSTQELAEEVGRIIAFRNRRGGM